VKSRLASLILLAILAACAPRESPEQVRARALMDAAREKLPDAVFGKVWANGEYTCGRLVTSGIEKGFFGKSPANLWIEGPDTEPYYGRAWIKFCSAPKPALFAD
jgi:hypothetical protein